ncbi:DUF3108 domain-containing protein [Roseateles chitosanitabidus]|jgi:hypothetical protein|uniref:DUF3108 domain-containing protein n=1 Tax=Roseateles chitosanitabidus TaxID=65048 RepID=UPI00082C2360|nr:DUF3108 domain-containing protein [Roseateles chitosanitabidus]MBO9688697.1 DUF3108 domain-containing protein [Roseateles chitosanitabidus]
MAGRLSPRARRGALGLGALTLAVLAAHLLLLRGAQGLHDRWMPETPEPDRLEAAFVRELQQAPPPPPPQGTQGKVGTPPPKLSPTPASTDGLAPLSRDEAASAPPPPEVRALVAPSALAVSDAVGEFIPGVEWPLSTELDYQLTGDFRGPVYGDARVQWLRSGAHYQVHLEAWVGPSIAPLMSRRLSSDGEITPEGLAPRRFDEVTGGLAGGNRHATLLFDVGGVRMADGRREPVADGTQDAASQFVQLTWMFLTGRQVAQGDQLIQQPLALPRNVHLWRYKVRDLEDVATPLGPIPAWHIDSDMDDPRGDMQAEFWLAPSLQFMPVRVRIWQDRPRDPRTHIDLVLKRPPRQAMAAAAPASGAASGPTAAPASSPL